MAPPWATVFHGAYQAEGGPCSGCPSLHLPEVHSQGSQGSCLPLSCRGEAQPVPLILGTGYPPTCGPQGPLYTPLYLC